MKHHKNMHALGMILAGLLMAFVLGSNVWTYPASGMDIAKTDASVTNETKIVAVDEVVKNPEKFNGTIGVTGKVVSIDKSKSIFFLGCEDICVKMPVEYKGQMPEVNSDIVIFGEIRTINDGKRIFEGQAIKPE